MKKMLLPNLMRFLSQNIRMSVQCHAMLLLTLLFMSSTCSLRAEAQEIVFKYVPSGYTASVPGYWASEPSGRLILESLRTYRQERDLWRSAYETERDAARMFHDEMAEKMDAVDTAIDNERNMWKKKVSALERQVKKRWGVGVFAGYDPFRGESVCGVGLTYSIVRF